MTIVEQLMFLSVGFIFGAAATSIIALVVILYGYFSK